MPDHVRKLNWQFDRPSERRSSVHDKPEKQIDDTDVTEDDGVQSVSSKVATDADTTHTDNGATFSSDNPFVSKTASPNMPTDNNLAQSNPAVDPDTGLPIPDYMQRFIDDQS